MRLPQNLSIKAQNRRSKRRERRDVQFCEEEHKERNRAVQSRLAAFLFDFFGQIRSQFILRK